MVTVLEDGAPVHTSKQVKSLQNMVQFPTAFHQPASPDLNPIKNCRAVLKQRLHALPTCPTSLDMLLQAVTRLWDEMEQDVSDCAAESMNWHKEDLRKAKGGTVTP